MWRDCCSEKSQTETVCPVVQVLRLEILEYRCVRVCVCETDESFEDGYREERSDIERVTKSEKII